MAAPRRWTLGGQAHIQTPSRLSRLDAALVLLAAATLTGFPFARLLGVEGALVLLVLSVVGWRRRVRALMNLGLFGALLVGSASFDRFMNLWPLPAFVAALGLLLANRRSISGGLSFLRPGIVDRKAHFLIVASAVVAGLALIAWFALAKPDYAAVRATLFPPAPTYALLLGVVVFAAVNGALEELAYRGVLLDALDAALGAGVAPVVIQALAFGALHVGGFPRGAAGVGLAAVYGIMMGIVRRQTRGLLVPWLAHILVDVVIGTILIASR